MPNVLVVAGSDSSCGAGIAADLQTVRALGCNPLLAVTAVTAQTDDAFLASHPIPPIILRSQLEAAEQQAVAGIDAVKVGMLPDKSCVETLIDFLESRSLPNLVVDPLIASSSRAQLASDAGISSMCRNLFPLASIVTPNLPEAHILSNSTCMEGGDLGLLAKDIIGFGSESVLVKGGHLLGKDCIDFFLLQSNPEGIEFRHPRLPGGPFRGTGCRLASAIAARLALGDDLALAVENARRHLLGQLRDSR